jgi:hypothetical protein
MKKNKTSKIWDLVTHKVVKRKKVDKKSAVKIDGKVVETKRLIKEMSRHGYGTAFPYGYQGNLQGAQLRSQVKDY